MTAKDFRAWQEQMGWTNTEIARQLQRTRNTVIKYRRSGAPLYIALAAAALTAGLKPWAPPASRS